MNSSVVPALGNLAWAPLPAVEEVEIFDRHNGVPSLGTIRIGDEVHLFWRVLGYTGDISLWLYLPLSPAEQQRVQDDETMDALDAILARSGSGGYVTVGVADGHRLTFEREWRVPNDLAEGGIVSPLLEFVTEALQIALDEDLPLARRQHVQKAQEAVRHLAAC
jgi:hypothetical protein